MNRGEGRRMAGEGIGICRQVSLFVGISRHKLPLPGRTREVEEVESLTGGCSYLTSQVSGSPKWSKRMAVCNGVYTFCPLQ